MGAGGRPAPVDDPRSFRHAGRGRSRPVPARRGLLPPRADGAAGPRVGSLASASRPAGGPLARGGAGLLAGRAWDDGRIADAHRLWRQLLPPPDNLPAGIVPDVLRFPDSRRQPTDVLARMVLASCLAGHLDRGRRELDELARLDPDATGTLAGRTGLLREILGDVIAEAAGWSAGEPAAEHSTFAGAADRNGTLPVAVDIAAPRWQVQLDRPTAGYPGTFPVVAGGLLFVADPYSIHGYDLATGTAAWSSGDEAATTRLYPPDLSQAAVPTLPLAARPRTSLAVAGGRLYARIGAPVTDPATREPRQLNSFLVALDIDSGQGRLALQVAGRDLVDDDGPAWSFEGPPVADGDRLYVGLRRGRPRSQLNVACLDAHTGEVIWNRTVCQLVPAGNDARHTTSHNLLCLADDSLFYTTDVGTTAAIDPVDGTIRWLVIRRPGPSLNPTGPCLVADGMVLAAWPDGTLVAMDEETGRVHWERKFPGGLAHLLGTAGGRVIASGRSLWAVEIATGRVAWRRLVIDAAGAGVGQGLLARRVLYWTTRTRLHQFDPLTGRPLRQPVPLDLRDTGGGNLLIAGRYLVITGSQTVTVFEGRRR